MTYIGIDPGKNGAVAIIKDNLIEVYPYSEIVLRYVCENNDLGSKAIVENVHAMPGQGVVSMFNFGQNFGYIKGVLDSFSIPTTLVSPQKWKKYYGLHSDKQESINKCKSLFPNVNLKKTNRCKNDSDGMAEALLIAEWGRMQDV